MSLNKFVDTAIGKRLGFNMGGSRLHVVGQTIINGVTYSTTPPVAGQVLVNTDGLGTAEWQDKGYNPTIVGAHRGFSGVAAVNFPSYSNWVLASTVASTSSYNNNMGLESTGLKVLEAGTYAYQANAAFKISVPTGNVVLAIGVGADNDDPVNIQVNSPLGGVSGVLGTPGGAEAVISCSGTLVCAANAYVNLFVQADTANPGTVYSWNIYAQKIN